MRKFYLLGIIVFLNIGISNAFHFKISISSALEQFRPSYNLVSLSTKTQTENWQSQIVDDGPGIGFGSSIAFDSDGNPYIGYFNLASSTIEFAWQDGSNWVTEIVDGGSFSPSLVIDSNGQPHLSYYSQGNLMYAWKSGASWQIEIVDGGESRFPSLALDSAGRPHISYYNSNSQSLNYAWHNGSNWMIQTIDNNSATGVDSSLKLDENDKPHIGYRDSYGTENDPAIELKYAWFDGGAWNIEVVSSNGVNTSPSLRLDSDGRPHLSYTFNPDSSTQNSSIKHAWRDQSIWYTEEVIKGGIYGLLELDGNDMPHIIYFGGIDYHDFRYIWQDYSGYWHDERLDNSAYGGGSLQQSNDGNMHVSYTYHDSIDEITQLRYAFRDPTPDLSLSNITASKLSVVAGETITYTTTLLNSSTALSTTFNLSNSIPMSTTYVIGSAFSSSGTISDTSGIEWTGIISPSTILTNSYSVVIDADISGPLVIFNNATVIDSQMDSVELKQAVFLTPYEIFLPSIAKSYP